MDDLKFEATLWMDDEGQIVGEEYEEQWDCHRSDVSDETDVRVEAEYDEYIPARIGSRPEDSDPAEGGQIRILTIKRDVSGAGEWQDVQFGELPDSVHAYLVQCVDDELAKLTEDRS